MYSFVIDDVMSQPIVDKYGQEVRRTSRFEARDRVNAALKPKEEKVKEMLAQKSTWGINPEAEAAQKSSFWDKVR